MKAAAILAALVLPALAPSAVAGEVGQYAVVMFPRSNAPETRALIVDTKNGNVWEWNERASGYSPRLFYQGQATPGKDSGPLGAQDPAR
jgi:hypothetical protein